MRYSGIIVFLVLLCVPREAKVSKLHLDRVDRSTLVSRAPVIVIAAPEPKSRRELALSLGPGIQPYSFVEERYRVAERLRGPESLAAGALFTLTSFDPDALEGHIEYYAEGLSRSYQVMAYEPDPPLPADPAAPRILFLERRVLIEAKPAAKGRAALVRRSDGFALVCWGAMENVARKEEVAALADQHPCPERLDITVGVHGDAKDDDGVFDEARTLFPDATSFSGRTVNIRPSRRGRP